MTPRMGAVRPAAIALAALSACAAPRGVDAPLGAPGAGDDAQAIPSPARWVYQPRSAPVATAAIELGDGRCLVATDEGERWLVPHRDGRCAGMSLGTAPAAPEPLRRVGRRGAAFRFVGETGTLFDAQSPLGAFERISAPPEPLARVAARDDLSVGIASDGTPYRLGEDGWVAGDAGGARLFDVAVDDRGRALAIAWPELVLTSVDGGATFAPASPAPTEVGAIATTFGRAGLGVGGVRGSLTWREDGAFVAGRRSDQALEALSAEVTPVEVVPLASAAIEGRAALTGSRWAEARLMEPEDEGDERWTLLRGPIGGPLSRLPLADVPADHELRLAAQGDVVAIAFVTSEDEVSGPPSLSVRRSLDGGATFVELARLVAPDVRSVRLAASTRGDVVVTAACPRPAAPKEPTSRREEARRSEDDEACRPRAPVTLRRAAGGETVVVGGAASELRGAASAPAFSPDGALTYFVGRRAKGEEPAIFVSDDGGRTYVARPLGRRSPDDERRHEIEDEHGFEHHESMDEGAEVDLIDGAPISVDGEGNVGLPVSRGSGIGWQVADAEGATRGAGDGPSDAASVGGWGRRALAVELDGERLSSWESSDGGASWWPAGTLRVRIDGDLPVTCGAGGCAVGEGLVRVGWGVGDEERAIPRAAPSTLPPSLRTPIACDLDPKGWTQLPSAEMTSPFPSLDEIARGRAAWSVLSVDRAKGAVTVRHVASDGADQGRIVARSLVDPIGKGEAPRLRVSHQGEGYAVARQEEGKPDLEIAWVNFFDGVLGKRTLPIGKGKQLRRTQEAGAPSFDLGLLSVSTGGVFVQPVAGDPVSFLDARAGRTESPPPVWASLGVSGQVRDDAARLGGKTVFVGALEAGATVGLLATRRGDGSFAASASTIAPPIASGAHSQVSWTYVGLTPGFLTLAADASGEGWSAGVWRPFGEDGRLGAPVAVPTLLDLPDRPRPCREGEVRSTPRVEARVVARGRGSLLARGRRHPVAIVGAAEDRPDGTLHLLTTGAVLHGTPGAPCLAGLEATGFDGRRAGAVILGDLSRAWVFRPAASSGGGRLDVDVRAMSCRWDPGSPIPDGAWDEVGVQ